MTHSELSTLLYMIISPDEETHSLGKSLLLNSKFYKQYKNEQIYWQSHRNTTLKTFIFYCGFPYMRLRYPDVAERIVNRILFLHSHL